MISFKIVRKIGKILRGGAGAREMFLGALLGVMIGMIPGANLATLLTTLVLILLSANLGFAILGFALGKVAALLLAPVTFQIGFTLIHNIGLEGLFRTLNNAPVTALMGFDSYCQIGAFFPALILGTALGLALSKFVTGIRKQMLKAKEHDKVHKTVRNPLTRFLLWIAFGRQKMGVEDVLNKKTGLLRPAGLILLALVLVIGTVMELLLLDTLLGRSLTASIAASTGAEVNLDRAHLSLAQGKLELENLQVTNPDELTHNQFQIATLAADVSIRDLLSRQYTINLVKGSRLQFNTLRETPGKRIHKTPKKEKTPEPPTPEEKDSTNALDAYVKNYEKWKEYLQKARDYLAQRKEKAEEIAQDEKPKAKRKQTKDRAKERGYLKTVADNLVIDRPRWTIHRIEIDDVILEPSFPHQQLLVTGLSSHPELNGAPTELILQPAPDQPALAQLTLQFDQPAAPHKLAIHLSDLPMEGVDTGEAIPLNIQKGKMNLQLDGTFDIDQLNLPFTLNLQELQAGIKEGESIAGLDASTANRVISTLTTLSLEGNLDGSLLAPKLSIDHEKLQQELNDSLVAAGKKELKNKASQELNKLLDTNSTDSTEEQAKGLLKKLF